MSTEFQKGAHEKLNPGSAVAKLPTVKSVEDLLALHNDEQTTAEINRAWKELRATCDNRAQIEERMIGGKLSLTIEYKADGDTGKKELTITHALSLPKPPSNTRTLYEDANGALQTVKPSKQQDLFPNVISIKKGV